MTRTPWVSHLSSPSLDYLQVGPISIACSSSLRFFSPVRSLVATQQPSVIAALHPVRRPRIPGRLAPSSSARNLRSDSSLPRNGHIPLLYSAGNGSPINPYRNPWPLMAIKKLQAVTTHLVSPRAHTTTMEQTRNAAALPLLPHYAIRLSLSSSRLLLAINGSCRPLTARHPILGL
jgi:hypothetical protein